MRTDFITSFTAAFGKNKLKFIAFVRKSTVTNLRWIAWKILFQLLRQFTPGYATVKMLKSLHI